MPTLLSQSEQVLTIAGFIIAEQILLISLVYATLAFIHWIYTRLSHIEKFELIAERLQQSQRFIRNLIAFLAVFSSIALLALNGWIIIQDQHPFYFTINWLKAVPEETWLHLGAVVLKIVGVFAAAKYLIRALLQLIHYTETRVFTANHNENTTYIQNFFKSLRMLVRNVTWMLVIVFAASQLPIPMWLETFFYKIVTLYLIISLSWIASRTVAVVVSVVDGLSQTVAENKHWQEYYQALRPLVPLLRRSLEYVIWIAGATLVVSQLQPISSLAEYGPRLIQAIGIFFLARVVIEAGNLFIDSQQFDQHNDNETANRRRATIIPLAKTIFSYSCYFMSLVLILGSIGIDIMPFLAGAGILGVVLGLGAQSLINDIVSGFFILLENTYLVGDIVDTGHILGTVEKIDFRTTRIRDPDGNLHTIRNGEITRSKNFCKDFTFAVVEIRADYDTEVPLIRKLLEASGQQLKAALPEWVTGDIVIVGIVEFEPSAMRFKTTTPVVPGKHFPVATRLREIIKQNFDEAGVKMPPLQQKITVQTQEA